MSDFFDKAQEFELPKDVIAVYPHAVDGYFFAGPDNKLGVALRINDERLGELAMTLTYRQLLALSAFCNNFLALTTEEVAAIRDQVHAIAQPGDNTC
ncbi:Uncharacterised protein [Mycolicibacterium flavescens]|uniref:hypothetical protein n=1 Tax=Mycobacterium neumannii TaxID=2048551 RepID=UPI000B94284C|nr:hypothetical protein [Mycobacterium neumannii]VEG40287.1 Uncharacterised protein [Mycolicibacterium flavescens]